MRGDDEDAALSAIAVTAQALLGGLSESGTRLVGGSGAEVPTADGASSGPSAERP